LKRFFGTDGIRGLWGHSPLTAEELAWIGYQTALQLQNTKNPRIVIGCDTRSSCHPVKESLLWGFSKACLKEQLHIDWLGVAPTPAVSFMTRHLNAHLGIMISASHNLGPYNGLKYFNDKGYKFSLAQEQILEERLQNSPILPQNSFPVDVHDRSCVPYLEKLTSSFQVAGLKVALDCAQGAFYQIAVQVLTALGVEIVGQLGTSPNGANINELSQMDDPFFLLKSMVLEKKADLGISFDGDGDRVLLIDAQGVLIDGDQILAALLNLRPQSEGLVGTLMSNQGLEQYVKECNRPFHRSNVGDRFVSEALTELGWTTGGEACGHIVLLDHLPTGDGLYVALCILDLLRKKRSSESPSSSPLSLFPIFKPTPSTLINVSVSSLDLLQQTFTQAFLDTQRKLCQDKGRILVRPSGTEPVLRILVEHADEAMAYSIGKKIADFFQTA
jgi:phosphoglucosamine mutase